MDNLIPGLAWHAEFFLEIDLKILLEKTGARSNFKIGLISLHTEDLTVAIIRGYSLITYCHSRRF
jgi:hypothetical protein